MTPYTICMCCIIVYMKTISTMNFFAKIFNKMPHAKSIMSMLINLENILGYAFVAIRDDVQLWFIDHYRMSVRMGLHCGEGTRVALLIADCVGDCYMCMYIHWSACVNLMNCELAHVLVWERRGCHICEINYRKPWDYQVPSLLLPKVSWCDSCVSRLRTSNNFKFKGVPCFYDTFDA